jgi:hypothetical protein
MKTNWLSNISSFHSKSSSNTINEANLGFWDNAPVPKPPKKLLPQYFEDLYEAKET